MSSNVGLTTPRGSGTSGYVQRNHAFMKPRNAGAPYPAPVSDSGALGGGGFRQRQPDRKILEHDRMREVEVRVMEERERLEERNEVLEEEEGEKGRKGAKGRPTQGQGQGQGQEQTQEEKSAGDIEEGETSENATDAEVEDDKNRILSEEEIDARCEALRAKLLRELEDEQQGGGGAPGPDRRKRRDRDLPPKERKQFKAYQVHELAEAKIQETERLRKALGIREDSQTGEISSSNGSRFGGRG